MEKQKTFRVIITKDPDDIGYVADIQSLKYCVSYADTIDEAIVNIKETLAGVIQVMQDQGIPIPDDSNQIELSETKEILPVPIHGNRDMRKGLFLSILKKAGIAKNEVGGR